ncbi:sensor histidine kinase [Blastococcus deserti]|uniref:histidine kinase n=1 Tax=Blastococcus deserti TaxID=2259033 RepID=A0ABW4X7N9_9ACTN
MAARSGWNQEPGSPVPAGRGQAMLLFLQRLVVRLRRTAGLLDRLLLSPLRERVRTRRGQDGDHGPDRPALSWLLPWLATGLFAVVLLALNVGLAAAEFDVPPLVAVTAGIGQSAALILILVRPAEATALQFLAVTVFAIALPADSGSTWPLTVTGMFTLVAHVGLVAARTSRRAALMTWWASALLLALVVQMDSRSRPVSDWLTIMIVYAALSALVLGAVLAARRWREIRQELAAARHDVEVEQRQRAVAEERTRIARELHDVVAHSMSVIHMQATSASYRLDHLDPETQAEFARIAAGARSTMRELRHVLAMLRDEGAEAELAPVPDLARLRELVDSAGRAGVPVEMHGAEAVQAAVLPEAVARAAYRIVQESLSNVIRHAPGARTTVRVDLEDSDLVLSIVNDAGAHPDQPMESSGRAGLGLPGMRERARLVGGSVETGTLDDGGYRVVARLPIGGHE